MAISSVLHAWSEWWISGVGLGRLLMLSARVGDATGTSVARGTQPELMLATMRPKETMFSLLRRNDIIPNLNQEVLYTRIALHTGHSLSGHGFGPVATASIPQAREVSWHSCPSQ